MCRISYSHTSRMPTPGTSRSGTGKEISIPLPVLLKSEERGWDLFLSSHLHHGNVHHNYYIAKEGKHAGKVVEKNSRGEEVKPWDLSLTKNVCGLLLSCGLLLFIVLRTARWYKKHPYEAPGGFTGLMEMAVMFIHDGVVKEGIGKEYKPFSSYLLTVFFFILINNLIGIIPIFPGGANITGNITITAVLAFMYVPGSEPVRYQGILEGDILAQCPYLPEVTVADHALRGIFRHTHQAVRPDDPSVCQYHGRTYNHSGVDLPDIHHRLDGNSHKRHDDNRIRIVHRVYELSPNCWWHAFRPIYSPCCRPTISDWPKYGNEQTYLLIIRLLILKIESYVISNFITSSSRCRHR